MTHAWEMALLSTNPHTSKASRTRGKLDLDKTLHAMDDAARRRLVSAVRMIVYHPTMTNTMPDIHDAHGELL